MAGKIVRDEYPAPPVLGATRTPQQVRRLKPRLKAVIHRAATALGVTEEWAWSHYLRPSLLIGLRLDPSWLAEGEE